ncbi:hypothetical protein HYZ05_01490 [Candidatus Daviesbacteria bacterium]|nr:hypothetical protein [Candidatus Daviesbacteria bacterium]
MDQKMQYKNKKVKNDWEYFDDCMVCQYMKKVEEGGKNTDLKELEIAFAQQNLKNELRNRE